MFKKVGPLVEHEYTCACGDTFRSYLTPEQFERLGWIKDCTHCQLTRR